MNRMLAANKYEKCSKMYFPLLSLMIEISEEVTTTEKSKAKYDQNDTVVYKSASIQGRKNKYPKLSPAERKGKVAERKKNLD